MENGNTIPEYFSVLHFFAITRRSVEPSYEATVMEAGPEIGLPRRVLNTTAQNTGDLNSKITNAARQITNTSVSEYLIMVFSSTIPV